MDFQILKFTSVKWKSETVNPQIWQFFLHNYIIRNSRKKLETSLSVRTVSYFCNRCLATVWLSMNRKEKHKMLLFIPDKMKVIEQDWREKVGEKDVGCSFQNGTLLHLYFMSKALYSPLALFLVGWETVLRSYFLSKPNEISLRGKKRKRWIWWFARLAVWNTLVMLFLHFSYAYFNFCIFKCICFLSSPSFLSMKKLPQQK